MEKYIVECRRQDGAEWQNLVGDYTWASSAREAYALFKSWVQEQGVDWDEFLKGDGSHLRIISPDGFCYRFW